MNTKTNVVLIAPARFPKASAYKLIGSDSTVPFYEVMEALAACGLTLEFTNTPSTYQIKRLPTFLRASVVQ